MKITVGLGSIDDYRSFAEAGADEVFCGYIPEWWTKEYGILSPLNRREVLYYNVQIGSFSEMQILADLQKKIGIPVSITLNALFYRPEQYPLLKTYIQECLDLGFSSFIAADSALLFYLREQKLDQKIHLTVSGEFGELNPMTMEFLSSFSINRMIFHRHMTFEEMQACMTDRQLEYEAFVLNEKCHFHGGFCNGLHCDELCHICQLPYQLIPDAHPMASPDQTPYTGVETDSALSDESDEYLTGRSGCGLCALYELQRIGITHLKLVGRGSYSEDITRDITALKKCLQILEHAENREDYIHRMKQTIFPDGCSGYCYY